VEDWQGIRKMKNTSVMPASKEGKKDEESDGTLLSLISSEESGYMLLSLISDCTVQERTGLLD